MTYSVHDNFCPAIDQVKQSAFDAGFDTWKPNKGEVGTSVYDGMGFWGDHAQMVASIMRAIGGVAIPNTMYFRATNVGMEKAYIHSDRQTGNHTCICYLTDHEEESGTAFFTHKRTGLKYMPSFDEMKRMGIFDELKSDMVSRDPGKWTQTDYVRGVKNRALIFEAPLFHSRFPIEGIGRNFNEARIVWVSHFNKLSPAGDFV